MSEVIKTTCPYCGVGCGVLAQVEADGQVTIKGDPEHPSNFGRLCSKGAALGDTLSLDGRLLFPVVDGESQSWDAALNTVAERFQKIIKDHGADSVAFYVSGQLLTEDYYVANKLMKGFIGSANIDTNSRLCMSSAVAGQKRAFGSDTVPCNYEDLERAKLVILTGSNTAWCHPVLFQRIKKAKQDNPDMMVVVIDPRHTATCDIADLYLPIKSGMDHVLFNGLLVHLKNVNEKNEIFVDNFTEGLDAALAVAESHASSSEIVANHCGLAIDAVEKFYRLFARTERVVTVYSQGINQWSYGTDRVNSIINCHLYTGRIGRKGMGPFSLTGQPNAMGGREVGGLANQLAAHMAIENEGHREIVKTFWDSPNIAEREGLKAVDLFSAIDNGKIKAVWIMATNPAVSMPDTNKVKHALAKCEFVVVSDCMKNTDTTRYANVLLPAQTWGERDGTVTSSERRISRQHPFLPSPGEARPDWWIISEVAKRMGFNDAFLYKNSAEIFNEHAKLSGFKNQGTRDFDISGLQGLSISQYDNLKPIQWPVTSDANKGTERLFANGHFYTSSHKAQFIAVDISYAAKEVSDTYPLRLNTGRIRDQWHTMTRTGKAARLSGHIYEPFVELHPNDSKKLSLNNNELAQVSSELGNIICRVNVSESQQQGNVFVPIHWNDEFASSAVVGSLINATVDPFSGQPEFKSTPVNVKSYATKWYGFVLSRRKLNILNASYWTCSRGEGLWRYEIAGDQIPDDWAEYARSLLCQHADAVEWAEYFDSAVNRYRAARVEDGRLESCIFIGPDFSLPERDWLVKLFKDNKLNDVDRKSLLTGKPASGEKDAGKAVCACFSVGINTLVDAIKSSKLSTPEQVGELLRAGTNCGSCIPEIRNIIKLNLESE
ncbi:MAG: molybdopterin-dependent oxidoreductase [Gammaproteobacteria bacterium]|nr:molybdopterin-dependent oxidoreductase [Gammaproteobacteria bacterium]